MNLTRLVYHSQRCPDAHFEAAQVMASSYRNNRRDRITGFLLATDREFVQVLEGSRTAISRLYHRISADPRHRDLVLLSCMPVRERRFASWSMGLKEGVDAPVSEILLRYFATDEIDPATVDPDSLIEALRHIASDCAQRAEAALAASDDGGDGDISAERAAVEPVVS